MQSLKHQISNLKQLQKHSQCKALLHQLILKRLKLKSLVEAKTMQMFNLTSQKVYGVIHLGNS